MSIRTRRALLFALTILSAGCRRRAPSEKVKLVTAGLNNTCTLDDAGKASCFGPTIATARVPPPGTRFESLTAAASEACGLLSDKSILCFGSCSGRCDPPSGAFDEVAVGSGGEACALSYPANVRCWGFGAPFR